MQQQEIEVDVADMAQAECVVETPGNSAVGTRERPLAWTLRALGLLDMCAVFAVILPRAWMEWGHTTAGLGELPAAPIVGYLARSASALYALHGLLVFYVSFDVRRYEQLIRFFAAAAVVHGVVMLGIDLYEGMPAWWSLVEGPSFAATGLLVLIVQSRVRYRSPSTLAQACSRAANNCR